MDTNQPTANIVSETPSTFSRGVFGTKMPASIAFAVGILLFFMPFSEIRCGGSAIMNKSGLNFAIGSEWKATGGIGKESLGQVTSKTTGKKEGMAQPLAIAAAALGLLGLLLCYSNTSAKTVLSGAAVAGVLAAGALIGLMFEVKKWYNDQLALETAEKVSNNTDDFGLGKMGDDMKTSLAFTPWFYISIISFILAAYFCYKRMSVKK